MRVTAETAEEATEELAEIVSEDDAEDQTADNIAIIADVLGGIGDLLDAGELEVDEDVS